MQDFTSHLLRAYFASTDWHPHNSYLHLTSLSSSILLDFPIPNGLSLSISSSPSPIFFSTHRLRALPQLAGSLGYIFASTERPLLLPSSRSTTLTGEEGIATRDVGLRDVLERFRIVNVPSRPVGKDEVWQGGERVDTRDYLLYGCIHAPTARLDALYTTRLAPTWNLIVTACSFAPQPPPQVLPPSSSSLSSSGSLAGGTGSVDSLPAQPPPQGATSPGATNLQVTLQNDTGRWFNEFSYSVDDALWGFRTMHHFGPSSSGGSSARSGSAELGASSSSSSSETNPASSSSSSAQTYADAGTGPPGLSNLRANDEAPTEVGGGLKGRFSAGAELFFSAAEKSAGLSTGVRFTTLPEDEDEVGGGAGAGPGSTGEGWTAPDGGPTNVTQPPTTITATLNPMMGHLSTAYAARMGRDVVACSRFDFNVYSYESEMTVGGEYWLRPSSHASEHAHADEAASASASSLRNLSPPLAQATHSPSTSTSASAAQASHPHPRTELSPRPLPPGVSLRSSEKEKEKQGVRAATTTAAAEAGNAGTPLEDAMTIATDETSAIALPPCPPSAASLSLREGDTGALTSAPPAQRDVDVTQRTTATAGPSGLLKWSLNSSLLLSLLWQGRLRNCIVAVGVRADLTGGSGLRRGLGEEQLLEPQGAAGAGAASSTGGKKSGRRGGGAGNESSSLGSGSGVGTGAGLGSRSRSVGVGVGSVIRGIGMDIVYWGGGGGGGGTGTGGSYDSAAAAAGDGVSVNVGVAERGHAGRVSPSQDEGAGTGVGVILPVRGAASQAPQPEMDRVD